MIDEAKPQSEEVRIAMESRQRAFEQAHDIWATVFSPLRPRRPAQPAAAGTNKSAVADSVSNGVNAGARGL
jgi:hypothetical protein